MGSHISADCPSSGPTNPSGATPTTTAVQPLTSIGWVDLPTESIAPEPIADDGVGHCRWLIVRRAEHPTIGRSNAKRFEVPAADEMPSYPLRVAAAAKAERNRRKGHHVRKNVSNRSR